MKAWDWTEEQMKLLADRLSDAFEPRLKTYLHDPNMDLEWLEDAFYGIAETTAAENRVLNVLRRPNVKHLEKGSFY